MLKEELGEDWRDKLAQFDPQPLAAASIGQVHSVVLHSGQPAAMKIQVLTDTHTHTHTLRDIVVQCSWDFGWRGF